jgi:nucleoside-diphosphate-sugar epimerase
MTPLMILFNGATGGLGRHLGPLLADRAVPHRSLDTRLERASDLPDELTASDVEPDVPVVLAHLAALVSVPACEEDPDRARAINVDGTAEYVRRFLDWANQHGHRSAVVYVSSGHVYAPPEPGVRVDEDAALAPRSVYAGTKLMAEEALIEIAAEAGTPLTIARVFGLLAPGQPRHYVLPALIDRVKRRDVTEISGLNNVRDYLDARDVVAHLHDLARWTIENDDPNATTVNVCSGIALRIADVLEVVIDGVCEGDAAQADALRRSVTEAPSRASDITWLVGSPDRLQGITGQPSQSIVLETTVRDAIAVS